MARCEISGAGYSGINLPTDGQISKADRAERSAIAEGSRRLAEAIDRYNRRHQGADA